MNVSFILNDPPDVTERSRNALRLACSMSMQSSTYVRIFLVGSGVACARKHTESRAGSDEADEVEALVTSVIRHGGEVRVCEYCRGEQDVSAEQLVEGTIVSSLNELARRILESERLLVF